MIILAIETSCDETGVAIVEDGVRIRSNVVASSHEMHEKYGGIVPEVAARKQLDFMIPTLDEALQKANTRIEDLDAVAITVGPGLIGSLLVGVETAKTIAAVKGIPIIPVNHVLAHMYANFLEPTQENSSRAQSRDSLTFPAISLVVSGGHTELYLMESPQKLTWLGGTIDDAAGECFDKSARLLGFGNAGGPAIQKAAATAISNKSAHTLPRPLLDKNNELNFSFSGLKTAILRQAQALKSQNKWDEQHIAELASEVQEAVTDVLVKKTLRAVNKYGATCILLSGGVAANARLREKFTEQSQTIPLCVPPVSLCTDNAAYIASYAYFRGTKTPWENISAVPDLSVEELS